MDFHLKPIKFPTKFEEIDEHWGVEPADPRSVNHLMPLPDIRFSSGEAATAFCAWLNSTKQAGDFFDLMWDTAIENCNLPQRH